MSFFIENIEIGRECAPLVIPEIGINHGGSLKVAFEMVDAANRAGAKLIKHQTHIVYDEMSMAAKNIIPGNADISIYQIMENCSLSEEKELDLKKYIESKGMIFLSTPFSRAAVDRLERVGVSAYKIGSGEMNNYPLIEYISSIGKPIILSTGMNNIDAVSKAVAIISKKNVAFALMHTTNLYPTPSKLVRLGAMQQLMEKYPQVAVGLSDHTINNNACIAALSLGASIVERHFTDSFNRKGPDIVCSMDEKGLKELIIAAQEIPMMLGGEKKAVKEEAITIAFAFSTVVSIKAIKKGEFFTTENIWVKRPGVGEIHAEFYNNVLGRRANKDIEDGIHIKKNMIEKDNIK